MPRTLDIIAPPEIAARIVNQICAIEQVMTVHVSPGAGVKPPGDVVTVQTTNRGIPKIMAVLTGEGLTEGAISVSTSEPISVIHQPMEGSIFKDTSEASWEEMDRMLAKESNMTFYSLTLMAIAGFLAVMGLMLNTLHIVIASQLIAPGFEPIVRISMSLVGGEPTWRTAIWHTIGGYLALMTGAAATMLISGALGLWINTGTSTYLEGDSLMTYWTTFSPQGLVITAVATVAGAVLVITNRSVLTAGVMVALTLIPIASLMPMTLILTRYDLFWRVFGRFGVEILLILGISAGVFVIKRYKTGVAAAR